MNKVGLRGKVTITSGIWYTCCSVISSSIGFLTTPIFARLLSTAEYGEFSNIQTWMVLLVYVASINLDATLLRASQDKKSDIDTYVLSMAVLAIISTMAWGGVIFCGEEYWCKIFSVTPQYLKCIFLYMLFQPGILLFQTDQQFKFRYKYTVFSMLFLSIGSSLLSVLFVLYWPDKLSGRVIGYLLPTCILGCIYYVYYIVKGKHINVHYWRYAIPIAIPYIPHVLSLYLLHNMDKVMIRQIRGAQELGLYSIAYTCGILLTIIAGSVNSAFAPWLAEKLNGKEYDVTYKISYPYVLSFAFLVIGIVLISPEILYVLGGTKYMEAVYVIPPVAVSCLVQFVYCMYVNVEQFYKKTVTMALASMLAVVCNFLLNYLLIGYFGYVAAAYTTLASYLLLLIMHMYFVMRLGYSPIYNNKKIIIITFVTIIIVMFQNIILKEYIIRYSLLVVYIFVICLYLLKTLKKVKEYKL